MHEMTVMHFSSTAYHSMLVEPATGAASCSTAVLEKHRHRQRCAHSVRRDTPASRGCPITCPCSYSKLLISPNMHLLHQLGRAERPSER